jgi:hypothetical protein
MTITLKLTAEIECRLREKAARAGETLEAYIENLVTQEVETYSGAAGRLFQSLSDQEFDHALADFSEGLPPLPPLPPDFRRADMYSDHD